MNKYRDVLLCSEDYIKTYTNISDNTAADYIAPAMYMAQHSDLEVCLGTALVYKIQELVATGEITDAKNEYYKILLDDHINDYLAYATIVRLLPIVSFKIGNAGVVRTDEEKVVGMSYDEVFGLTEYYKHHADYLQYRMQRFLIANYTKYPELSKYKSIADLQANLYSAASVGIYLGGARGKSNYVAHTLKDKYDFPNVNNDVK